MALRAAPSSAPPSVGGPFAKRSSRLQLPWAGGSNLIRTMAVAAVGLATAPGTVPPDGAGAWAATDVAITASRLDPASSAPFDAPLGRPPLDPPLMLNGGFGEFRSNHFHAGLDLGTGGQVGRVVHAPLPGWIERVRASGVGYGRSLYLHTDDGRLLVFGHLDAFAQPVVAFVDSVQRATGQYEQDLWPERGRFRVALGQPIAWTGESGAGGPHLHVEVRRGDMAYHPMRAGLAVADVEPPTLVDLTLEPLDDTSYVERSAAPVTVRLGAHPETLRVQGRVRAVVGARDGVWRGVDRMVPWSTTLEFAGERVECRFDSVSWATDMVESDYVYDWGRVVGQEGLVMWAPAGFRPRVLKTSAPENLEAGTLTVRRGDPPRPLRMVARDVAGHACERTVVLRAPRPGEWGPDSTAVSGGTKPTTERQLEFAALPGGAMRVELLGAPAGSRDVWLDRGQPGRGLKASLRGARWAIVIPPDLLMRPLVLRGRDGAGLAWEQKLSVQAVRWPQGPRKGPEGMLELAPFETTSVIWELDRAQAPHGDQARELVPETIPARQFLPATIPLKKPARVRFYAAREWPGSVGIYRRVDREWEFISRTRDSSGATPVLIGESRRLGEFAVFADTLAPRVTPLRAPAHATAGPYSRWALEARVVDEGAGVDPRASWFEVDGRRVPSEWDGEAGVLRWRPLHPPARSVHRFTVVATDRAGNARRAGGSFTRQ